MISHFWLALNLVPTGFAAQRDEHSLLKDFDLAAAAFAVTGRPRRNPGAPQRADKAEHQHGAVAQAAIQRLQHDDDILGQ